MSKVAKVCLSLNNLQDLLRCAERHLDHRTLKRLHKDLTINNPDTPFPKPKGPGNEEIEFARREAKEVRDFLRVNSNKTVYVKRTFGGISFYEKGKILGRSPDSKQKIRIEIIKNKERKNVYRGSVETDIPEGFYFLETGSYAGSWVEAKSYDQVRRVSEVSYF